MIKLVIFDLDGCFTDGSLHQHILNAKDTYALKKLINAGIPTAIISKTKETIKDPFLTERVTYIYTNVEDKIETCKDILNKLNINFNEVAYIGDDEPDIDLLSRVKIPGCPNDAIEEVKKVSKFISTKNGGKGAVREFVDFVLSYNEKVSKPIVAVIGVRKGSSRCVNKNIRDFGNYENLLEKKLKILNSVDRVSKIIVSSDSTEYLEIAKKYKKVFTDIRPEYYASTQLGGKELFQYLGDLIDENEIFMYSPVVVPFLNKEDYEAVIDEWEDNLNHDSVATFHSIKQFAWNEKGPINYDYHNPPRSQDLPEFLIPTFGICLIDKKNLKRNNNVLGKNPKIIVTDKIKSLDIDDAYDFTVAKLLNENGINDHSTAELYLSKNTPLLMDCTVRDGGYRNDWNFSLDEVGKMYSIVSDTGIQYFEIGFRSPLIDGKGLWFYTADENILKVKNSYNGKTPAKIVVMIKYGEYSLSDITENSPVDMYRILIKSKDYNSDHNNFIADTVKKLNILGKEVALNIPCGHSISPDLKSLFDCLKKHECKVNVFYLADTFGSMDELKIIHSFRELEEMIFDFEKQPIFGFHAHNNNNDALEKTIYAFEKVHRVKYVDSCITGMGRGIGNLKTEDIISKLNKKYNAHYDTNKLYEYVFDTYSSEREIILYKLSADYLVHPSYVKDVVSKNLNFSKSLLILKSLSSYKSNSYIKSLVDEIL